MYLNMQSWTLQENQWQYCWIDLCCFFQFFAPVYVWALCCHHYFKSGSAWWCRWCFRYNIMSQYILHKMSKGWDSIIHRDVKVHFKQFVNIMSNEGTCSSAALLYGNLLLYSKSLARNCALHNKPWVDSPLWLNQTTVDQHLKIRWAWLSSYLGRS